MDKVKAKLKKIGIIAVIIAVVFFVVTFTVYFFNLDMKLTAALEPYFEKWHDRVPRERKL